MIAISAGHYPEKPGACFDEFCEHGEAVQWAKRICEYIGSDAFYVPSGHLKNKVLAINNRDITVAAEIHFNSFKHEVDGELVHAGEGCETLYHPDSEKGAYIANEIQQALAPTLFKDRGIKPGYYRMNPKNGVDFFLRRTRCPAIIIEPEFIHHKDRIQDTRDEACKLIAKVLSELE